jgi:hypothetical protein
MEPLDKSLYRQPILNILQRAGGQATSAYVLKRIEVEFRGRFTTADWKPHGKPGNTPVWKNRVHWAKYDLRSEGKLQSLKFGVWGLPPSPIPRHPLLPPVTTTAQICKRLDVTTLTVNNWRKGTPHREPLKFSKDQKGRILITQPDLFKWLRDYRPDLLELWQGLAPAPQSQPANPDTGRRIKILTDNRRISKAHRLDRLREIG